MINVIKIMNIKSTENLYLKICRWGIFLSVFTPLVLYSQLMAMFHFPKVIVFRSIIEIILIFFILLILGSRRYRPKWSWLVISITVFVGLYVLTGFLGANPFKSFWGSLERMGGAFSFLHYWVFFIILISIFKTKQDYFKLLKFSVMAGFLNILYAYGQHFNLHWFTGWQKDNVIGTIGNPALYAGYTFFTLFLAAFLFFRKETSKNEKIFYGVVLVLGIPTIFLSAIRGAMLSFLGALFLLALFNLIISKNKKAKQITLAFLILAIILASLIWFSRGQSWVQSNVYLKKITDISLQTTTIQTRLWSWQSALKGWQERFWFGWGPENFNIVFAGHFDSRHYIGAGSEIVWDRAHNTPLNIGVTMGLIGLLSYLSIYVVLMIYFVRSFRNRTVNKLSIGILGALLITHFGHNLFIFDTFNSYLMLFITLGLINCLMSKEPVLAPDEQEEKESGKLNYSDIEKVKNRQILGSVILIPLMLLTVYQTEIIPYKANRTATYAIALTQKEEKYYPLSVAYFKKALAYNSSQGQYEVRERLAKQSIKFFSKNKQLKGGITKEDISFTLDEVYKSVEANPLDPFPYLFAARINALLSRIVDVSEQEDILNKTVKFLEKADVLSNKQNPFVYFELGQVRIFQKQPEEAIKLFEQAIILNPKVNLGYWYAGVMYIRTGEIEKGEDYINKAFNLGYTKNMADIRNLITAYAETKNYPKIIELYLEAIELEPENGQHYASLATAYKENGQIDKAIETARRVGEVDPNLKAEADAWIRMIEGLYK